MPAAVAHAFARHLHGDATADTLGIGRRWIRHLFPFMLLNNRLHGWWRSVSPQARAQAIEQAVANFHGLLAQVEGDTAYQTHLSK